MATMKGLYPICKVPNFDITYLGKSYLVSRLWLVSFWSYEHFTSLEVEKIPSSMNMVKRGRNGKTKELHLKQGRRKRSDHSDLARTKNFAFCGRSALYSKFLYCLVVIFLKWWDQSRTHSATPVKNSTIYITYSMCTVYVQYVYSMYIVCV